MYKMQK